MGMTMIEKILARAAGREQLQAGDTVVCRVDMNILVDLQFTCWVEPLKIADPPARRDHPRSCRARPDRG
jgi:3-isopropylmalate/(R)-2-methylmalate dehydratase large subunit